MSFTTNRALFAATLGLSSLLVAGTGLRAAIAQDQTPPPVAPPVTPPTTPPVTPPATTPPATTPPATTPPTTTPATPTTVPPAGDPTAATPPTAPAAVIDPAAKAIITQMVAAQKALSSYSATITSTLQTGTNPPVNLKAQVSYEKPNKAIATVDVTGIGKQVYQTDGAQRFATNTKTPLTFAKAPATKDISNIGATLQPSRASASGILPLLVTDADATTKLMLGAKSVTVAPDGMVDGLPVDVVKATTPGPSGANLVIEISASKTDHLLRRLDLTLASTPDQTVHITETYTGVMLNPSIPASVFAFKPAPGMKLAVASAEPAEAKEYDARIKVGAKPLPFAGTDLGGKSVSLATYKGKVVLLDFWATWCPPCREEIPNVVAAYNKFHPKGFEIVGVSLDRAEDRAKLVSYTKEHAMPWRQVYDGKFWESAVAKSYGVQAIPFSVLIGKDGKIIAVNPRGPELDPAVKAALAK